MSLIIHELRSSLAGRSVAQNRCGRPRGRNTKAARRGVEIVAAAEEYGRPVATHDLLATGALLVIADDHGRQWCEAAEKIMNADGCQPVGLEYTIVAATCFFSQQGGAVRRRSGTRA